MKKFITKWEFEKLEGYTMNEIVIEGEILIHAVNDQTKIVYTKQPNSIQCYLNEYDYVKQVIDLHAKGLY